MKINNFFLQYDYRILNNILLAWLYSGNFFNFKIEDI